jgi:von Willebrand factor type A domain
MRKSVPIILGLLSSLNSLGQELRLDFANKIHMVDCQPVSSKPCFTTSFNIVDANGAPYPMELPGGPQLVSRLTMTADGVPAKVFYASTSTNNDRLVTGRVALVLVDVSGSMAKKLSTGETRFEAAQSALLQFLEGFQDGVDQVAIVPFESHHVDSTILSAMFARTKQGAIAQLNHLEAPRNFNNTALFSAVADGLKTLDQHLAEARKEGTAHPEAMLVVMTDGRNEVLPGDDPGLLTGEQGLEEAAKKVSASGVSVISIGFGEKNEIDENALRRLSTRPPYLAADLESLKRAFTITRGLLVNRIQVAFLCPWRDRVDLAGKTIHFKATLALEDGSYERSNEGTFETPQLGLPLFEGKASLDELAALNAAITASPEPEWLPFLRPIFVFLSLGGLLLVSWFWVPRLLWPGKYLGRISIPKSTMKWSNVTAKRRREDSDPTSVTGTPSGFLNPKSRPAQRRPEDATVLQPISDNTRMRLHKDLQR